MLNKICKSLISAALCISLAGCSFSAGPLETASPSPSPTPNPADTEISAKPASPSYGGTLNLSMRLPLTLNPLLNEDETVDRILSLIFEPLAVLDGELKPTPNPALVKSIDVSADMLSVLVMLDDNAVWSDGGKITARDVAFSLDTLKSAPETVIYKESASNVLSTDIVNQTTIKINLIEPYGQIAYLLCFPIIPEHYYKNISSSSDKQMRPVGNGVYTFEAYKAPLSLTLRASESSLRGLAYIETVNVIISQDDDSDYYAFEQCLTDVLSLPSAKKSRLRNASDIYGVETLTTYFDFIGFNFNIEILADKDVREAVARCVPYEWIRDAVYLNSGDLAPTPINPASWLWDSETLHRNTDIDEAANFIKGKDIPELTLLVNEENSERVTIAEALAENLAKIGITCSLRIEPFEEYERLLAAREYDIFIGGYRLSAIPDLTFMLHSSEASDGTNILDYRDERMDSLLYGALYAYGEYNSINAYGDLQKYISEQLPIIGLVFRKSELLLQNRIAGPVATSPNNIFTNVEIWYIMKE